MTIRKGKEQDLLQVHELIKELAYFEKAPEAVETTIDSMREDGFGKDPVFDFYVAVNNDQEIVGLALYYIRYSTWKGKLLYLEDLIVSEKYRMNGIGRKLMDAVFRETINLKCKGIQWQVLDWNEPAILFYKKYNPGLDPEWVNCRMTIKQIRDYLSTS
jgi:ribosomal protein S18 acetylase RimI-like enzyme